MIACLSIVPLLLAIRPGHADVPEVTSYARVTKYGHETGGGGGEHFSWSGRSQSLGNEGRSAKDISITVSPVYVPARTPKLKNGEAIDYPSTPRYSTLDHEMLKKLNGATRTKQIESRFHPPAVFEHSVAHANAMRQKPAMTSGSPDDAGPPALPASYDYQPDFLGDKPISKPISIDSFPAGNAPAKETDSYEEPMDSYRGTKDHRFPGFPSGPPDFPDDDSKIPGKPLDYPSDSFDKPNFQSEPHHFDDHGYPELIYDQPPDFHDFHDFHHHHHDVEATTMPPEMNDQRLDKRPYSYYYIGKKLWYVPLYFSIYFIIYIAALVLKSVSRHKINLPAQLAEVAANSRQASREGWWDFAGRVLEGIESFALRFGKE